MPFAQFSEELHLGHEVIDAQHASLFEAVNRLHDAMLAGDSRQELSRILAFLSAYTVEHFQTEEAFMRETGYPGMAGHKTDHDALIQQVKELEARHAAGSMTISITIMNFLKDWLVNHIAGQDRNLAVYLRRN